MTEPQTSTAAFRASVTSRLKALAQASGRPINELQREFVIQRFLARVVASSDSPWILKGGTGLLIRLPGARYSQDADLLHPAARLTDAVAELEDVGRAPAGDPFRFVVVGEPVPMVGGITGATVKFAAYLGATVYAHVPVDLSTELPLVAGVDRVTPRAVLDMPTLQALPHSRCIRCRTRSRTRCVPCTRCTGLRRRGCRPRATATWWISSSSSATAPSRPLTPELRSAPSHDGGA